MALYKGKRRLYVCKSPTKVLLLLPKSKHSLGATSPYTGPRYTLPPYLCDFNDMEMLWSKIKRYVREHNVSGDLSLTRLQHVTESTVQSVSQADIHETS